MHLLQEPSNLSFVEGTTSWLLTGSKPRDYDYGSDTHALTPNSASGSLKSRTVQARGFATLMQAFKGSEYLGKRLRLSAYVKTQEVEKWAGLWMRVDGSWKRMLSFDNMHRRPIRGTNDWQKYEVVLNVPQESVGIFFGILLAGKGHVWLSNVQFETVSERVLTTDR